MSNSDDLVVMTWSGGCQWTDRAAAPACAQQQQLSGATVQHACFGMLCTLLHVFPTSQAEGLGR